MLVNKVETDVRIRPFIRKIRTYDENLYIHSMNVAKLTEFLVDGLNYPEKSKYDIVCGALLHDIGKTYLPFDLVNKHGFLTCGEYQWVKNHPMYGYDLLKDFELSETIMDIVLHHHENEVGEGYPYGSTFMHEETKIVSLCDKYEAIHSKRPYKQGYTHTETMGILDYEFGKYTDVERIKDLMYDFNDIRLKERISYE